MADFQHFDPDAGDIGIPDKYNRGYFDVDKEPKEILALISELERDFKKLRRQKWELEWTMTRIENFLAKLRVSFQRYDSKSDFEIMALCSEVHERDK